MLEDAERTLALGYRPGSALAVELLRWALGGDDDPRPWD